MGSEEVSTADMKDISHPKHRMFEGFLILIVENEVLVQSVTKHGEGFNRQKLGNTLSKK